MSGRLPGLCALGESDKIVSDSERSETGATVLGVLALVFWSTTIAFARSLSQAIGPVTVGAVIFTTSGSVGCVWLLVTGRLKETRRLSKAYLFGCGALFVFYMLALYLAVGLAATAQQVLEVGIINYLWPGLTLAFAIPILHRKARLTLWPGIAIAFAGVVLVTGGGAPGPSSGSLVRGFLDNVQANAVPYVLALAAAVSWALYSNLSRRLAGDAKGGAVPLFLLASGIAFLFLRLFFHEETGWTTRAFGELAYMALLPTLLAYAFWEHACRRGNIMLVAALSYATPLLSTGISCIYLGVAAGPRLWAGCGLVVAGAVVCRLSAGENGRRPHERAA